MRDQRVLIYGINYAPEPTGVGRYTGDIGAFLSGGGISVEVVTAAPHYPGWTIGSGYANSYSTENIAGVRVTRCPLLLKANKQGIWRFLTPLSFALSSAPVILWRALATRPTTLMCVEPTLLCAPMALLVAKIVGAKTVLHVQDLEVDAAFAVGLLRGKLLYSIIRGVESRILRCFDRVITISNRMLERLLLKGVPPSSICVVRNWVDLDKIKPLNHPSTYRTELNLGKDDFIALYAGNVGAKQALHIVLDAAKQLIDVPGLTFVIAGEGPAKIALMREYCHLPNVMFLPVQPEERLCELLNLADVHILPQMRDTTDLVLPSKLGGMLASGKQCIVMADPGSELAEFLGDCVVTVPAGSDINLATALKEVMSSIGVRGKPNFRGQCIAQLDMKRNLPQIRDIVINHSTNPECSAGQHPSHVVESN